MRSRYLFSLAALVTFIGDGISSVNVRADYILNGGEAIGTYRIRDDGTLVGYYSPPEDVASEVETYGEDFAVTPDFQTVYQFTNTLGVSGLIFAYDTNSREYLPGGLLHVGCCDFSNKDQLIINASISLIRSNDPYGAGDLFSISENFGYPQFPEEAIPKIQRFDRETDQWVESILPPTSQHIYDFAFGPDNRLYMAAEDGIFVYEESSITHRFDLLSSAPLLDDVTGTITFGPDGRLYVRNAESGNVDRYTLDGMFVDNFILAAAIPENTIGLWPPYPPRGSVQFGVDGNLHLLVTQSLGQAIGKYDGENGELISLIHFGNDESGLSAIGRVTYLPIPEPASLLLIMTAAILFGFRLR